MKCKRFKAAKTNFWLLFLALNSIKNSVLGGVRFMADDAEQPLDPVEEEAVADGEVEVRSVKIASAACRPERVAIGRPAPGCAPPPAR